MRTWVRGTIAVGAALAALTARPAYADLSLDVQPARYELEANAGSLKTIPITVRNVGTVRTHVVTSLADLETTVAGEVRFVAPGATKFSAGRWSSVNPREFDLEPGAFTQIRYTVSVPQGAHGEYATLVLFSTRPPRKPGGFGLTESVASRMYIVVGDIEPGGAIAGIQAQPEITGMHYAVTFKNTGTMHEYIKGYVTVTRDGATVDRIDLPSSTFVARAAERMVSAQGKILSAGSYVATAILDFGGASRVAGKSTFIVH